MAITFPQNPDFGDTYAVGGNTFVFDGKVWLIAATGGQFFEVRLNTDISDTAPVDPNPGDIWLNATTGQGLVYFDDGDTQQWVDIGQPGPIGATGFTGSRGQAGGYTGSQGFTGSQGPAGGYTGSRGPIGFTGSQGPAGGYTGSQGFVGSQGDVTLVQAIGFSIALGG